MANPDDRPWYSGISRYQWLVLAIAAAGWAFDQYESQIFVITKDYMLPDLTGASGAALNELSEYLFAVFLLGSAFGGLIAGSLADRFGRRPLLVATILFYSIFSGLTYFATDKWQLGVIRFFVAAGVGGEWAVGASLIAEVFPTRARTYAASIFHASGQLGFWIAALVGIAVGSQWRYAYLVGILPAILTIWVLARVHEPEKWEAKAMQLEESGSQRRRLGSFRELLFTPKWSRHALLGCLFAGTGLATFWCVMVAGQDLTRDFLKRTGADPNDIHRQAAFAYGIVQTIGCTLGLLAFGPICARFGRRASFIGFNLLAFAIVPITCFAPQQYWQLLLLLPLYGFFTEGFHAGYAMYFPELFPTHLRATGTSFCFNGGRIVAIPALFASAWLKGPHGVDLRWAVTILATLYLVGAGIMLLLPETNHQELPE
ncbi:MAG TPA: MFS transporter [Lacipirellulaceae bacterium]|jgi:MFS family permease|nr:MFS transporter [Lacipirellulaceae bacterium]